MNTQKAYLSLEEVAGILGVNYQLIYRQVRTGQLPAARIGRVYRVARADLDAYIESSKVTAGGMLCSACGRTYQSAHSVRHFCGDAGCGAPICFDCWSRGGIRYCAEHGDRKRSGERGKRR